MRKTKSIEKILSLLIILSTVLVLTFSLGNNDKNFKYFFATILVLNIFVSITIVNYRRLRLMFSVISSSLIFLLFLAITFRKIRDLFPKPTISENVSIGFAQYFGYPLLFDSILFFSLIFVPIIIFFLLEKKVK